MFDAVLPMASVPRSRRARTVPVLFEAVDAGWVPIRWDTAAHNLCLPDG